MFLAKALPCLALGLTLAAVVAPAAGAAVVLNEVDCETDWVELVNTGTDPVDMTGWLLTDDALDREPPRDTHRYTFPDVDIAGLGSLTVDKGATGFPFGISCGDDTIRLADVSGVLADEVVVPELAVETNTWGRFPNGTGTWAETKSTKGAPNEPGEGGGGGPSDLAAWMYDPHSVVEIDLGLSQESIDALAVTPDEYVDGTFSLTTTGGTYGPYNVGIRLKGSRGSFRPLTQKAAFKLKINHSVSGQRFFGLKKMTLNNMVQDRSMIREVLGYRVFREMNVPSSRTGYSFVRLNGDDYGVYLNIETMDDVSLPRWYDSTQHLYEGTYGPDFADAADVSRFEVDEGNEDDRSDLEALIAAVNGGDGDWSERVAPFADLAEMTRMWATEKYVGQWDGYSGQEETWLPNNYFAHSDATGLFSLMPWGIDLTWGNRLNFTRDAGHLFDLCLIDESCAAMYRQAVIDVRDKVTALDLRPEADALAAMLAPWQQTDPRKEGDMSHVASGVQGVKNFISARPGDAENWLNPPPEEPAVPDDPATPPFSPTPAFQAAPAAEFALGQANASARVVTMRLRIPSAGRVRQRGTTWMGSAMHTACTAQATFATAGEITLRCRLKSAAKRRLRCRSLRLKMRTWFAPAQGRPTTAIRKLTVPRSPRSSRC